jgi:hypothetical protein
MSKLLFAAIAFLLVGSGSVNAQQCAMQSDGRIFVSSRPSVARCLIQVEGRAYVDGPCTVSRSGDEFISVGEGRNDKYSAHVSSNGLSAWNGGGSRINVPLGRLRQRDNCWENEKAKICVTESKKDLSNWEDEKRKCFASWKEPYVGTWFVENRAECRKKVGDSAELIAYTPSRVIGPEINCKVLQVTKKGSGTELSLLCDGEGVRSIRQKEIVEVNNGRLKVTSIQNGRPSTDSYLRCP